MFVGVVLNPLARKNRREGAERLEKLRRILGTDGDVIETRSLDELGDAVERLLPRATHLVSDGGDGALHWLINEVRAQLGDADTASWPTFVPTNGGTIDFVAHKVGVRGRSEGIARALALAVSEDEPPPEVEIDSLHLEGAYEDGRPFDRIGFALAAGGVGNRFFDKYYEDPEPSPKTIVDVIARTVGEWTLKMAVPKMVDGTGYASHLFKPTRARVWIDEELVPLEDHSCLHAGSFDVNLGGVVRVFPFAKPDGVLHFQAGEISPAAIIANLPALATGGAIRGERIRDTAGQRMRIEALDEPLRPILDGERYEGLVRLEVSLGPRVRIARVRAQKR